MIRFACICVKAIMQNLHLASKTSAVPFSFPEKNLTGTLYDMPVLRLNSIMDSQTEQQPVTFEDLLVSVGQKQDRNAFIRLFEYFAPRIKSFLMKGGLLPDEADELAQETMLTVWHKAGSYDPKRAAANTWIFTIARNKKIDALRKRSARPENQINENLQIVDSNNILPDEKLRGKEQEKALSSALSGLPPEQAALIEKAYFEHKSHSDIAAETKLPLGTVKSRIRLALDRLRHELGGQEL